MAEPNRATPLSHREPLEAGSGLLRIAEHPFVRRHILRTDPDGALEPLAEALGMRLPVDPLQTTKKRSSGILWLGPDEWMIVGVDDAAERIAAALAGRIYQLVDVSDFYTGIEVTGSKARLALMKLTTVDMHPRMFKQRMVVGSLFGQANAWLWLERDTKADGALFHLVVRASLADYVWCLLTTAGREWGMPEDEPVSGEILLPATAQSLA